MVEVGSPALGAVGWGRSRGGVPPACLLGPVKPRQEHNPDGRDEREPRARDRRSLPLGEASPYRGNRILCLAEPRGERFMALASLVALVMLVVRLPEEEARLQQKFGERYAPTGSTPDVRCHVCGVATSVRPVSCYQWDLAWHWSNNNRRRGALIEASGVVSPAGASRDVVHVGDDGGRGCVGVRDEERSPQALGRDARVRGWGHDRGQFLVASRACHRALGGGTASSVGAAGYRVSGRRGVPAAAGPGAARTCTPGLKMSEAEGIHTSWRRSVLLVSAITLHNIPEGLAVGVTFGAVGSGSRRASPGRRWARR